jgi:aspartyl-tRNA(Asn)/glutamyl-tRNA(Gln) amidotransferase subunit B
MESLNGQYVTTIGLEVHVELKTATKLFCGCPVAFGGRPNTRVCPICLGHPGTLPVPNELAVELATKIALALSCDIAPRSIFHRKNYFYPDMPKNYQISQYDIPIGRRGELAIEVDGTARWVGITRVHVEEDTGKSIHVGGGGRIHEAEYSLEDFNRAGTPLVEIVTEPDITSPEEARTFAQELRSILEYLDVSDVRMEEGSLRIDANISVARPGEPGIKAEVKNMNSMRSLQRALAYEEERQRKILSEGGQLEQSTRHWDEKAGVTTALRTKEYAFDYRYFPEPDLVPMEPPAQWLARLQQELPELPAERRRRFVEQLGLPARTASVLTASRAVADFYEGAISAATRADAVQIANWVANDLMGHLADRGEEIEMSKVRPRGLAELLDLLAEEVITSTTAKDLLAEMLETGRRASELVEERGVRQVQDREAIGALVDEVIALNRDVAERIRKGDQKPIGFLVGQVMKAAKGQANAKVINEILRQKLAL